MEDSLIFFNGKNRLLLHFLMISVICSWSISFSHVLTALLSICSLELTWYWVVAPPRTPSHVPICTPTPTTESPSVSIEKQDQSPIAAPIALPKATGPQEGGIELSRRLSDLETKPLLFEARIELLTRRKHENYILYCVDIATMQSMTIKRKELIIKNTTANGGKSSFHWQVWRRYSDFLKLYHSLCKMDTSGQQKVHEYLHEECRKKFPKKTSLFSLKRRSFDPVLIEQRAVALQEFSNKILSFEQLCSCSAVENFFLTGVNYEETLLANQVLPDDIITSNERSSSSLSRKASDNSLKSEGSLDSVWSEADSKSFNLRGATYLEDRIKVSADESIGKLVHVDVYKINSIDIETDHIIRLTRSKLPNEIRSFFPVDDDDSKKIAEDPNQPFFFIVNFQVPGDPPLVTVFYFRIEPLTTTTNSKKFHNLLMNFVSPNTEDSFRNERFKLIPVILEGPPSITRSTGSGLESVTTPTLIGQKLSVKYTRGRNYMECDVDIASNTFANYLTRLCRSHAQSLVVRLGFCLQGNSAEELPECLIGGAQFNHLDIELAKDLEMH